jgi:branched-chain amino acid transport system substrate-binding protein
VAIGSCSSQGTGRVPGGTIKIGLALSLTGEDAPDGVPAENGAGLAIKNAGLVCGASSHKDACFRLQAVTRDDVVAGIHDPARGEQNISRLVDDAAVLAVVGPLYDSVASREIPVASAAGLTLVSPATTNECLTQEPADGHCAGLAQRLRSGAASSFFRVVPTQLDEGDAAADLASRHLLRRRAYVLNDGTPFSTGLARRFATRFAADGGTVIDPVDLGPVDLAASNVGRQLKAARDAGADVVYFPASLASTAAVARLAMKGSMAEVPFISADRISSNQFAKAAGANADSSYYTVARPHAPTLKTAAAMVRRYTSEYGKPPGDYSLTSFDATSVVIAAIGRAIDDAGGRMPTRSQVLIETARTRDYAGAMGRIGFDGRGDTTLRLVTAFEWRSAADLTGEFVDEIRVE